MKTAEGKRKYTPFREEDAEMLRRDGEKLVQKGLVKTEGFDKSVVFCSTWMQQILKMMEQHKTFRMELLYDAEALNVNYCFFAPMNTSESDNNHREYQERLDPDAHQEKTDQIENHLQSADQ